MNKRTKIFITVLVTAIFLVGLFFLRSYLASNYGISADQGSSVSQIYFKSVKDGNFDNDELKGTKVEGDYIVVEPGSDQVCGSAPSKVEITEFEGGDATITPNKLTPPDGYEINQSTVYYLDGDKKVWKTNPNFDLSPTNVELDSQNDGLSLVRGPGWVFVQLNQRETNSDPRNVASGVITFPEGVTISQDSFVNETRGGHGVEQPFDGKYDLKSENDEIEINSAKNTVKFTLSTTIANDQFFINYCYQADQKDFGTVGGTIDLGSKKDISKLALDTSNYDSSLDKISIEARASNDKVNWAELETAEGESLVFSKNNYCYRYIEYTVSMLTDAGDDANLGLAGLNVLGADDCKSNNNTPDNNDYTGTIDRSGNLVSTGPVFWAIVLLAITLSVIIINRIALKEE